MNVRSSSIHTLVLKNLSNGHLGPEHAGILWGAITPDVKGLEANVSHARLLWIQGWGFAWPRLTQKVWMRWKTMGGDHLEGHVKVQLLMLWEVCWIYANLCHWTPHPQYPAVALLLLLHSLPLPPPGVPLDPPQPCEACTGFLTSPSVSCSVRSLPLWLFELAVLAKQTCNTRLWLLNPFNPRLHMLVLLLYWQSTWTSRACK